MNIVPTYKSDLVACEHLQKAGDDQVISKLDELMEWLQDMNWPVAPRVLGRISKLGEPLIKPILDILKGNDEIWKYWVIERLLPCIDREVRELIVLELNRIAKEPTSGELEEELNISAQELLDEIV